MTNGETKCTKLPISSKRCVDLADPQSTEEWLADLRAKKEEEEAEKKQGDSQTTKPE